MRIYEDGMWPSAFIVGVDMLCANCSTALTETNKVGRTTTVCPQCGSNKFYKGKKGQLANIIIKATRPKLNAIAKLSSIDYTGMLIDEIKETLINKLNPEDVSVYAELLGFRLYKPPKHIPKDLIFPVR